MGVLSETMDTTMHGMQNMSEHGAEDEEHDGLAIVSLHEFETPFFLAVFMVMLLILCVTCVRIIFERLHHKHCCRFTPLPESGWIILLGCVFGVVLYLLDFTPFTPCPTAANPTPEKSAGALDALLTFNAEVFFLLLIPPIIFEAGYHLRSDFFFSNLGLIVQYAVVGTFLNATIVGLSLFALGQTGMFVVNLSVSDSLAFGALISAVDPVAVLAIFFEIKVNPTLNILVFGESVLNDAVAIVLYRLFVNLADLGDVSTTTVVFTSIAKFFVVSFGGLLIGVVMALIAAWVTKYTADVHLLEPLVVSTCALLSYLLAEGFSFSGIMAILFCGIVMTRYVEDNMDKSSHIAMDYLMKIVASTAETLVFLYLGIMTVFYWFVLPLDYPCRGPVWDMGFLWLTIVLIIPVRFLITFSITALANRYRVTPVSWQNQFLLAFSGLRGAIAFALAFVLPPAFMGRNVVISTTLVVIWISVFVFGMTIKPIIRCLSIKLATEDDSLNENMAKQVLPKVMDHVLPLMQDVIGGSGFAHTVRRWGHSLDKFIYRRVVHRAGYVAQSNRQLVLWVETQQRRQQREEKRTQKLSAHHQHALHAFEGAVRTPAQASPAPRKFQLMHDVSVRSGGTGGVSPRAGMAGVGGGVQNRLAVPGSGGAQRRLRFVAGVPESEAASRGQGSQEASLGRSGWHEGAFHTRDGKPVEIDVELAGISKSQFVSGALAVETEDEHIVQIESMRLNRGKGVPTERHASHKRRRLRDEERRLPRAVIFDFSSSRLKKSRKKVLSTLRERANSALRLRASAGPDEAAAGDAASTSAGTPRNPLRSVEIEEFPLNELGEFLSPRHHHTHHHSRDSHRRSSGSPRHHHSASTHAHSHRHSHSHSHHTRSRSPHDGEEGEKEERGESERERDESSSSSESEKRSKVAKKAKKAKK